jgi:protein involved in polysaccharide export with SLBB domain
MPLDRSRRLVRTGALPVAVVFLLTILAPAAGAAGNGTEGLQPGDAIHVSFWREPTLTGDYPVDETGTVVLPLVGARKVTGVPPEQLKQQLLRDFGAQLRNQEVQITLLQRVRILGAVKDPGLYHVDATMTLGDAVALAGGATPNGSLDGIRILRQGQTIHANLKTDTPVAEQAWSGDQILVPERGWLSRNGTFLVGSVLTVASLFVYANYRR